MNRYEQQRSPIEKIKANWELTTRYNDDKLKILGKNSIFEIHSMGCIFWLRNFIDCPELIKDPAFSILSEMYNRIENFDDTIKSIGYSSNIPLTDIYCSLSELATKMANRTMTEPEYEAIITRKHLTLINSNSLMNETK